MIAPVSDGVVSADTGGVGFTGVKAEYIRWGTLKGGRKGRPWSPTHLAHRTRYLDFWEKKLGLGAIADIGTANLRILIPKVEEVLCELREKGVEEELMGRKQTPKPLSGKSLNNFCEGLSSFFKFCVKRGYILADPLQLLERFDSTPQVTRRALTGEEVVMLLNVAPPKRRLVYETALVSGLRRNELRQLTIKDLDVIRCGLLLRSEWTKNRKSEFQPIPKWLVDKLAVSAADNGGKLLVMSIHPERALRKDLIKAKIDPTTQEGIVDFHALRTTFVTLVHEVGGANDKETQKMARHSNMGVTFGRYVKARDNRMTEIADKVGDVIKGHGTSKTPRTDVQVSHEEPQRVMPNAQALDATVNKNPGVRIKLTGIFELVEVMGVEPLSPQPHVSTLPITSLPAIADSNHAPAAPPKSSGTLSPDVGTQVAGAFPTSEHPMNRAEIRARAETHAIAAARGGIAGNVQLLQSIHDVFHLLENPFSIDHILALNRAFKSIDITDFYSALYVAGADEMQCRRYAEQVFPIFQEDPLEYIATRNLQSHSEALLRLAIQKMQQS